MFTFINKQHLQEKIRSELKQMSIEELQKLKERIGLKLFNKAMEKDQKKTGDKPSSRKRELFKRENKNRPREVSAKRQVPRFRDVVGLSSEMNTKTSLGKRDPRFDSLCGEFDEKVREKFFF
jgi:ribosomal RNA-processing protein 36